MATELRGQVKIDDMQFGFIHGKSTTDAIFRKGCTASKNKKLSYVFVDPDGAFYRMSAELELTEEGS